MSIESKARARREAEEAEKNRPGFRLKLWHIALIGMPVIFAAFFLIGLYGKWDEKESRIYPGFTAADRQLMAERVQQDFDEPILYIVSEVGEEKKAASGLRYYDISYIVTTESSDKVYAYVFYKIMNSLGTHEAGSIELIMNAPTDRYEKGDITQESHNIHQPPEADSVPAGTDQDPPAA